MRPTAILSLAPWLPGWGRTLRAGDACAAEPASAAIWWASRSAIAGVAEGRRNQVKDLDPRPLALFAFFAFFAVPTPCFPDREAPAADASKGKRGKSPGWAAVQAGRKRPLT